ncbi:cation diffusion facilitator family transporter [Thermosynechococcaceae cyanobacterium Okahandja]
MPHPQRATQRVLWLTLGLNVLVTLTKATVGVLSHSLSLQADALHSFTDSASNVLGLVALQWATPHPDREHPYGHQKFEALGALGIAAFLGMACFEILQSALERLWQQDSRITIGAVELWLMIGVLGMNIGITLYEHHMGRKLNSPVLLADAQHTLSDVWVTIAVLLGLIGVWTFNWYWLDVALAFPVAALVFWSAWSVLKTNIPWLVDEVAIAPEAIYDLVMSITGVVNCHDISSRGMVGRQVFIEMHLVVDTENVTAAHAITEQVEAALQERYGPARIVIHVEPQDYQSSRITFS